MRRLLVLTICAILAASVSGCNLMNAVQGGTPTPSPTMTPTVRLDATLIPTATAGVTLTPTAPTGATQAATQPAATQGSAATATRVPPTNTPQPTSAGVSEVLIYLVAVGDNGAQGTKIGCDDSIIPVRRQLAQPTRGALRAALNELLSIRTYNYGESGFVSVLANSTLTLQDVTIENGVAIIELAGTLSLGGVCDGPRVEAQLKYTALQFSTVDSVEITVNGTPLEELLSGQ